MASHTESAQEQAAHTLNSIPTWWWYAISSCSSICWGVWPGEGFSWPPPAKQPEGQAMTCGREEGVCVKIRIYTVILAFESRLS